MARVLVTGATGYVGGALVRSLRRRHDVVATSRHGCAGVLACDLADPAAIRRLMLEARPTHVIHCAAVISSENHAGARERLMSGNVLTTANLALAALAAGSRRSVLCSSVEVYAPTPIDGIAHREADRAKPAGSYGASKLAAEEIIRSLAGGGAEIAIVRMPGIHGGGRRSGILRSLIDDLRAGRELEVDEPGTRLSFAMLDDVVSDLEAAAFDPHWSTPLVNAASATMTLSDLADLVLKVVGQRANIRRGAKPSRIRAMDLSLIQSLRPRDVSFEALVARELEAL